MACGVNSGAATIAAGGRDATSVVVLQSDIYRSRVYFYSANIHKSTGRIKGLLIPLAFCCRRHGGEPLKANVAVKWLDVIFPLFSWSEETTFLPIPACFLMLTSFELVFVLRPVRNRQRENLVSLPLEAGESSRERKAVKFVPGKTMNTYQNRKRVTLVD